MREEIVKERGSFHVNVRKNCNHGVGSSQMKEEGPFKDPGVFRIVNVERAPLE